MTIEAVDWHHPEARRLRDAQQAEIAVRYGGPGAQPDGLGELDDVDSIVTTLLVRVPAAGENRAVGVGSIRDLVGVSDGVGGIHPLGTGEVKRVYLDPAVRGRGLSRRLMMELESRAAAAGLRRLVLESGTMQPEAIGLYLSLGYDPIESYGVYAGGSDSRCFGKDLPRSRPGGALGTPNPPSAPAGVASVHIRHAAWDDGDAVALRRENFELSTAVLYPTVREAGFEARDAIAGVHLVAAFVAHDVDGPVGCIALTRFVPDGVAQPDTGELRKLYVRPTARGRGVARSLIETAEAEASAWGMRRVVLETGIRQHAAVRLYTSLGYRPIRPYPPYEDNSVALCFARELPA